MYTGREIAFGPVGRLDDFVLEIKSRYVGENGALIISFQMYLLMMVLLTERQYIS